MFGSLLKTLSSSSRKKAVPVTEEITFLGGKDDVATFNENQREEEEEKEKEEEEDDEGEDEEDSIIEEELDGGEFYDEYETGTETATEGSEDNWGSEGGNEGYTNWGTADDPHEDIKQDKLATDLRWHPVIHCIVTPEISYGEPLAYSSKDHCTDFKKNRVEGRFIYDPPHGTMLEVGRYDIKIMFIPINFKRYRSVQQETFCFVRKAKPVLTWNIPEKDQTMIYGIPFDYKQQLTWIANDLELANITLRDPGASLIIFHPKHTFYQLSVSKHIFHVFLSVPNLPFPRIFVSNHTPPQLLIFSVIRIKAFSKVSH